MTALSVGRLAGGAAMAAAAFLLAGCSWFSSPHRGESAEPGHGRASVSRPLLYSPNGEPLAGGAVGATVSCAEAFGGWFDRLDSNGDGTLSREEFLADARLQFARMDLDHDGWITPAELDSFRAPFQSALPAPVLTGTAPPPATGGDMPRGRHGGGGGLDGGGGQREQKEQSPVRPYQPEQADPVMSADVNLLFRVSQSDFLAQAQEVFARLDTGHNGQLRRDAVLATCQGKENRYDPADAHGK